MVDLMISEATDAKRGEADFRGSQTNVLRRVSGFHQNVTVAARTVLSEGGLAHSELVPTPGWRRASPALRFEPSSTPTI